MTVKAVGSSKASNAMGTPVSLAAANDVIELAATPNGTSELSSLTTPRRSFPSVQAATSELRNDAAELLRTVTFEIDDWLAKSSAPSGNAPPSGTFSPA